MSILNSEYREWFLTPEGYTLTPIVAGDTPTDQDNPIADKSKVVGGIVIPTIFIENAEPSAVNYMKLFKSIPFKLNQSDRARDDQDALAITANGDFIQGLVMLATDAQAKTNDNGVINLYSRVPRVSHLPTAIAGLTTLYSGFKISTIDTTPADTIAIRVNPAVNSRNEYEFVLSDSYLDWVKQTIADTKDYVDTITLTDLGVTTDASLPSSLDIQVTPPTGVATKQFTFQLNIQPETNPLLGVNDNAIPSQRAVKTYVDNLALNIASKADLADVTALTLRVDALETGKADVSVTDALLVAIGTKLSKTNNDTAAGVITFTQSPLVPLPTTANQAANKDYVDTELLKYYTKLEVDALLNIERNRITALETAINNILAMFVNYYTKGEVDGLLALKADLNHNHDLDYHPLVANGTTGQIVLQRSSLVTMQNGIVTGIAT